LAWFLGARPAVSRLGTRPAHADKQQQPNNEQARNACLKVSDKDGCAFRRPVQGDEANSRG